MIRIALADDHELVRQGMRRLVEEHPDLSVVAEVGDGQALLDSLPEVSADVVVLDVSMPGLGFLETLEGVRDGWPELPVLVVSVHPEEEWAVQALKSGASGYLSKRRSPEELIEAIRRVRAGGVYVTQELGERLASRLTREGSGPGHERLSKREFEVLCLLGAGMMVKTVAVRLGLSPRTVSTYRARILEKLGLKNTAELIRYATHHGLSA